jgi:hypothetical protein
MRGTSSAQSETGHGSVCPRAVRLVARAARAGALVACAAFLLLAIPTSVSSATLPEYQIKAAFLFNFAKFVTFPGQAFAADNSVFVIGVLGDDPFGSTLDQTVQGKTIGDRKIVVRRSNNIDDLRHCQIVFICASRKKDLGTVLAKCKADNILSVGESDGFATHGGVINFYVEDNKVRFEINPKAAERASLQISAQLLRLGRVVTDEQGGA